MPHDDAEGPPSLETDLRVAAEAIAQGDLPHAATHLAGIAGTDPDHAALPGLLDQLMQGTEDPLALVPLEEGAFYGAVALHAAILARLGEISSAVDLLLRAQAVEPEVPYVPWVERWLAAPERRAKLDVGEAFGGLSQCLGNDGLTRALLPTLRTLVAERPPEAQLGFLAAKALRTTGHVDEALAVARRAHEGARAYVTGIALAMALKSKEDPDGAVLAYRDAIACDPEDVSARLDLGDLEMGRRRWDASLAAYEEALALDPKNDWAVPSAAYVRALRHGDEAAAARLRELAAEGVGRAVELLGLLEPNVHKLRTPASSFAETAVIVVEHDDPPVRIAVSSMEPPSALLALEDVVRSTGKTPAFSVEFGQIPQPDPRVARLPVEHRTWTYEGTRARPALDADASAVEAGVAAIAGTAYAIDAWWERATAAGSGLGKSAVRGLIATMLRPPERPDFVPPWYWRFRVQVAAAMTLAGVDAGWKGSARRAALLSLLHGPVDWTTTAGAIALLEIARREAAVREEILPLLLDELLVSGSPIRFQCIVEPVVPMLLARVPLGKELREALQAMREREGI